MSVTAQRPTTSQLAEGQAIARALQGTIEGEVRFDDGSRALYATDSSNYRQVPIGVVLPRSTQDIIRTVDVCRQHGAPLLMRGGGTSLAGQCCNVAVVLDCSKYLNRVLAIDPDQRQARIQPGLILDDLRNAAERYHLTFGPDPATHNHCTLGGMIGNNSCGVHSVMAGKTDDNIDELDILLYEGLRLRVGPTSDDELAQIIAEGGRRGEIYGRLKALRDRYADQIRQRFPKIPRLVSGYNLDQLLPENGFHVARALIGSEGTCITVLEATARLVQSPPYRALLVLGYPDIATACDHVPELMAHKPIGLEGFDDRMIRAMQKQHLLLNDVALLPPGGGWLLVEFGGDSEQDAAAQAKQLQDDLSGKANPPHAKLFTDRDKEERIWKVRESGLGATAQPPGQPPGWAGWEDSAVAPDKMGDYLRDLRHLMNQYDYDGAFYGHFGQGCLHTRITFDLTSEPGIAKFDDFINDAADLVIRYGGSVSGEHGDGQARAALLPKMFGPELMQAFAEFKAIWDPGDKMNPGKVVNANLPTQDLRLGADYQPLQLKTHFKFPDDGGSFARATLRCVGVGKCRRLGGGTMCPSFMVTREENDSTRGRARMLFEMLQGEELDQAWHSEHVKDALDLCLACKGCKGDCPIHVDMATYKAEFLSHYYAGRLRPRTAYSMGLIYWWARLAALAPDLVNLTTRAPLLRGLAKAIAGIAPEREVPQFAPETFRQWFSRHQPPDTDRPEVLLWPDTFNNHFHPATAAAAVDVLEAAGFRVTIPERSLCCGRPLYDWGMLDLAERLLHQMLDSLRPRIRAGVPVVVLEPSCASVFRDELRNLLPHDEDAKRLSQQTYLLGEFLQKKAPDFAPPTLDRQAVVHGHCHHKAIFSMADENAILQKLGLDFHELDSGCCGMAGAFGFEAGEHYDVSIKCGERVLLPAVRQAPKESLIVTDGFSCREQIAQTTGRQALHLAQVIQLALHDADASAEPYPEREANRMADSHPSHRWRNLALAAAGAAVAAGTLAQREKDNHR